MFSIANKTKKKVPKVPFSDIYEAILGADYELSLVFCGDTLSHRLNKTYRDKDKPTNILSFPLEKKTGEIFIDLVKVEKEAKELDETFAFRIAFLFIHGCLHLKGFDHSSKMERQEDIFIELFLNGREYNHGNRHRNILD